MHRSSCLKLLWSRSSRRVSAAQADSAALAALEGPCPLLQLLTASKS